MVFYQEPTLHRTLLALRSPQHGERLVLELGSVWEPKDEMRVQTYSLVTSPEAQMEAAATERT